MDSLGTSWTKHDKQRQTELPQSWRNMVQYFGSKSTQGSKSLEAPTTSRTNHDGRGKQQREESPLSFGAPWHNGSRSTKRSKSSWVHHGQRTMIRGGGVKPKAHGPSTFHRTIQFRFQFYATFQKREESPISCGAPWQNTVLARRQTNFEIPGRFE